jgi:hypothetical protein
MSLIIRYEFNARNSPITTIQIVVDEGVTKVFAPGVRDTIIVPDGTGLDIFVEYRGPFTSDAAGRVEILRTG